VRKEQGKDPLKYRIVNKKKEELVRQLLIEFFIDEYNYPLDRIRSEEPVNIGKEKDEPEAADVVVLDNIGEWYIVGECKAATERVTKKDVKQGESYARTMRAQWLIMTNGRDVFDCYNDEPRTGWVQVPLEKLPRF